MKLFCQWRFRVCFLSAESFNVSFPQIYVGKEKEAISDVLPYLRLGYVSDPSEMQTVICSQGPICPVSFICIEFISLDVICCYGTPQFIFIKKLIFMFALPNSCWLKFHSISYLL